MKPKFGFKRNTIGAAIAAVEAALAINLVPSAVLAGSTIKGTGDSSITLGAGLRSSYTSLERGAPNGTSRSNDFETESVRIFTSGQIVKGIKGTVNAERTPNESFRMLDAIVQFEFFDAFNVWAGRMLPPSDRANLAGPYYANTWQYPGVISQYPAIFAGRDNGVTVWGKPLAGKLTYAVGVFKGHNNVASGSNDGDKPLFAGRIAYSLLDAEPAPAYYVSNTYYGLKDIFTLGAAYFVQADGVGTATSRGDYRSWNVDAIFEKKIGKGVLTIEGALYNYDLGGQRDCGDGLPGTIACPGGDNVGGLVAGDALLGTIAYLIPRKVSIGQFQPFLRHQSFKRDVGGTKSQQSDIGVNYVIAGHDARITAVYSKLKDPLAAVRDRNQYILGVQLIY
ncbi:hypothetical protein [Pelomicrobium methylotrophicum]|uniref:Porin n=1 Tax=Pelomicrobium methylotrophicum TaxID=2602750 RepID=A0A5C7EGG0_9PROT|nr:hypothetical protein [Pelomicrobium methylotrophicum]TXF11052.1 hypothetical protein FR698_11995 [Pelomicrobium methylotrophicum]